VQRIDETVIEKLEAVVQMAVTVPKTKAQTGVRPEVVAAVLQRVTLVQPLVLQLASQDSVWIH